MTGMLRGVNMDVSGALKQRGLDWRPTPEFGGWRTFPASKLAAQQFTFMGDGLVGQPSLTHTGAKVRPEAHRIITTVGYSISRD